MHTKEARSKKQETGFFSKRIFFFLLVSCLLSLNSFSQCAMCRASLESEGNKARVEAVNDGIVLLMAVPYIIVGLIAFAIYRMYSKKKAKSISN